LTFIKQRNEKKDKQTKKEIKKQKQKKKYICILIKIYSKENSVAISVFLSVIFRPFPPKQWI
jgi:hypothetical protein